MPAEPHVDRDIRGEGAPRRTEAGIASLAERQHGIVARRQLVAMGLGDDAIDWRLGLRRLQVVHRGVFAVGHRGLSRHGRWMAAVLAGGPGSVLSHRSAAGLWELRQAPGVTDVVVAHRRRSRPGLRFHQTALGIDEITECEGIPVTTVARTLLDLASVLRRPWLDQAIAQAERRRLSDSPSLAELIERYPGQRGMASLRAVFAERRVGLDIARSELELRFLALLRRGGLPRPEVNTNLHVGGRWFEVDCLWRGQRLVAELDGHAFHSDFSAFENDRARDRALIAAGYRTVRVTWRQLHLEPEGLKSDIAAALARVAP